MKKFLKAMAIIFGILAIFCFFSSGRSVEGLDFKVANIQDTVFCATSAISSALNTIGYAIYSLLEKAHGLATEEEKEVVVFCDNCGIRKTEEELKVVKMKTRKGIEEKKICKKCMELDEVKRKIVE